MLRFFRSTLQKKGNSKISGVSGSPFFYIQVHMGGRHIWCTCVLASEFSHLGARIPAGIYISWLGRKNCTSRYGRAVKLDSVPLPSCYSGRRYWLRHQKTIVSTGGNMVRRRSSRLNIQGMCLWWSFMAHHPHSSS